MARKLSPDDLTLLRKPAPEPADPARAHAGHEFMPALLPLSRHVSASAGDFRERLMELSGGKSDYPVNLIFAGMGSLRRVKKEHVDAVVDTAGRRISKKKAAEFLELYKFAGD